MIPGDPLAHNPPIQPSDNFSYDARGVTRPDDKLIRVYRFGTIRRASLVTFPLKRAYKYARDHIPW